MAEADKIQNLDQLETWLRTQNVRISRAIAARAALRALPVLMAHRVQIASKTRGASLLLSRLRATLISGVASTCSLDMKRMQNSAHAAVAPYAEDSPASATVAFASSAKFSASDAASTVYTSARTALSYSNALSVSARSATLSAAFIDAGHGRDGDPHQIFAAPLLPNSDAIGPLLKIWTDFEALPDPTGIWSFWRDWYRSMLQGAPMDWDLQLQVALIGDSIWQEGPEAVAKEIARIRKTFNPKNHNENNQPNTDPVTATAAETMAQRLQMNRDAICLTSASLLEQIAEFREKVRGNNHLEMDYRDQLLSFLDQLTADFRNLIGTLPANTKTPDIKAGKNAIRWVRDFKAHFLKEAQAYTAPENVANATIPTGIILGCTAVGSLVGMPVAGTVVGGLLTGQLKPGKAAD